MNKGFLPLKEGEMRIGERRARGRERSGIHQQVSLSVGSTIPSRQAERTVIAIND